MGLAAVSANCLLSPVDHLLKQRQVRCCVTPVSPRYKASGVAELSSPQLTRSKHPAVSGIANLPSQRFTTRGYRPVSRPLSRHKLRAQAKADSYQQVHDYIVLLKAKHNIHNDDAEAILDNFWSLQYMIPSGVVNGFAGPVKTWHANDTGYSMTHAVHLRFASLEHIHTFRQHEKLQQAKDKALSSVFDTIVEMSLTGRVTKDLDSIFRKGADWDLGVDHILVLQAREDASKQEMQSFLAALADVGKGPAINAMQTTYGALKSLSGDALGTHLVFTRLALQEELDALLLSPPHVALKSNDARLPAGAAASYAMTIAPAQAQRSRAPDGKGVLGVSSI